MPGGDGTGPLGNGPRGRGLGPCGGGGGRGAGGRGLGRAGGGGRSRRRTGRASGVTDLDVLRAEAGELERQLEEVKRRIQERKASDQS